MVELNSIHSFLIHPGKNLEEPPEIRGTVVDKTGRLFDMLKRVFDKAEEECPHDIAFSPDEEAQQHNECRDSILAYIKKGDLAHGRQLAKRLQVVTTNRSGLGLLFLMMGRHKIGTKIVVSRFPADSGILAEEQAKGLSVQFLERIFMKSATSYKAAVYSGRSYDQDFWKGKVGDKQVNSAEIDIAGYWIRDFLKSDFLTPGEAGTRRFALAVREAMNRSGDSKTKEEIAALCRLLPGVKGRVMSAKGILAQFQVSSETQHRIKKGFNRESLFDERFRFMPDELSKFLAFKTVEINNGGMLTAPTADFDTVFTREIVNSSKDIVRFSTQGTVVDQRFRRVRS
jgi:hypothetical protein